ncbi:MAG: glycosyltransferase family 4 protein [Candidatus Omnitrophica bacterium]|nr:glycosyltransferase family 4 protein [Candidatus Omnitrophota bacterium]
MNSKKILHIITRLDKGGSSENTLRTVVHLGRERTTLIAGRTQDSDGNVKAFIEEHNIDCVFISELVREIDPANDIRAFWKLFRFMREHKFDIVHTHSSKAGILGRWAAWCAGVKTIIHTPHGHVFYGYFGPVKTKFFIILEKITALITNKIITLTERGRQDHIDLKIAPAQKFIAIPSGICIEEYAIVQTTMNIRQELGIPNDATVVGTVSRLDPIKGNRYFIEAIHWLSLFEQSALDNVHFVLVGDGTEGDVLRTLVKKYGLDQKITFTGMRVNAKDIYPFIDIFVLASLMEGMGRVIIEAMVQSKPVIATKVGGIPEIVTDGVTGILVAPKDPIAMGKAILSLIRDPERARTMGLAGKAFVCGADSATSRFSIHSMLHSIDNVYKEYLEVRS